MKIFLGIFLALCTAIFSQAQADPLVAQCSGQTEYAGFTMDVQLEIVIPDSTDQMLTAISSDTQEVNLIKKEGVGVSTIQLTEQLGGSEDAKIILKKDFIVTHLPKDEEPVIIGFFFRMSSINVVQVDLVNKNKRFRYFDTFSNKVIEGTCKQPYICDIHAAMFPLGHQGEIMDALLNNLKSEWQKVPEYKNVEIEYWDPDQTQ